MFELGPFDLVVLGEGERPLLDIAERLRAAAPVHGISGTAERGAGWQGARCCRSLRSIAHELRDAIFSTPYEKMPYAAYWERLESAYQVGGAAEQGGARGAPRRDPLGAAHHAQLLPDGLHLLLGH